MSDPKTQPSIISDRVRFGRALLIAGWVGVVGALLAGISGWVLTSRISTTVSSTVEPVTFIVADLAETIEASLSVVERTTEAIDSIGRATRTTSGALSDVADVMTEVASLAAGDVADSLDSALATLPALIDTGRVIDRTMTALSFVGVDYSPEVPLDGALEDLESSLAPIPDQLRSQVELLGSVAVDLEGIATEAGSLAGVLLQTRVDMLEAEQVLRSASANATAAAESVAGIESEISTFSSLARAVVVAATLALMAAALAPLLIGLHYLRTPDEF
ncbi:MAG TPA: hypothetical protein VFS66_06960 [Acidimicrobiia bacterium]|nr:hypothetical protein [Acidimicrobiia bacterium]